MEVTVGLGEQVDVGLVDVGVSISDDVIEGEPATVGVGDSNEVQVAEGAAVGDDV